MPTSFQYRLQQHESAPPAEAWQLIALRLSEEFQPSEIIISKKLTDFLQEPPANLFSAISSGLLEPELATDLVDLAAQSVWPAAEPAFIEDPVLEFQAEYLQLEAGQEEKSRSPGAAVIPFNWPRLAVAAAVVGIAISALYYFASKNNAARQLSETSDPGQGNKARARLPAIVADSDKPDVKAPVANMSITGAVRLFRKSAKPATQVQQAAYDETSDGPETANTDITYAKINGTDRVVSNENIAIPTEPIRDNLGNIIMDEKLISAPDINYVTVTGPNGEQTKISKKFLRALSYMNAGNDDDQSGIGLQESSMWKWLFSEWRQKLLKQPTYIPSTTNFLDIMELKEILHENF
jgi:hypothetical protein